MFTRIISGGQTGVDRAALDVAIELGVPHGGWVPKGRRAEDGVIPDRYQVKETPGGSYAERTEQNVKDSDGTVILSRGRLTGGSRLTMELALLHKRPVLHVDLADRNAFEAAQAVQAFVRRYDIKTLNVAGPRASKDPEIYALACKVLKAAFYLNVVEGITPQADMDTRTGRKNVPGARGYPESLAGAVESLLAALSLKDRIEISKMAEETLGILDGTLGEYIRERFGLWAGNRALLEACRRTAGREDLHEYEASALIIKRLWHRLRETHRLRVVK